MSMVRFSTIGPFEAISTMSVDPAPVTQACKVVAQGANPGQVSVAAEAGRPEIPARRATVRPNLANTDRPDPRASPKENSFREVEHYDTHYDHGSSTDCARS